METVIGGQAGEIAPQLSGIDQNGNPISLSDFKGQKIVLFFYPKDNTPTCTVEACNLRDNYGLWQQKGFQVIGVSGDSPASHQKFIQKFDLPFPLVADTDHSWTKAFGVWGNKILFGKEYEGILRTSFLIDENGIILHRIGKVKSKSHTEQLLELLGE